MHVVSAFGTDRGRVRPHNEDCIWAERRVGAYVVADGLGGHEAGDVAGRLAAETVGWAIVRGLQGEHAPASAGALRALLRGAVERANERVRQAALEAGQQRGMGATLVGALVRAGQAHIVQAGDARAYLARAGALQPLTMDHTLVAGLVAAGEISAAEARVHPQRHLVTKIVGQDGLVDPAVRTVALVTGDWLLLCSDGLWNTVPDAAILSALGTAGDDPAAKTTSRWWRSG